MRRLHSAEGRDVGALTTLAEIEQHPVIARGYSALAQAAALAASPQIRNLTETMLSRDERVRLPPHPPETRSCDLKAMDRKTWAFALAGGRARAPRGYGEPRQVRSRGRRCRAGGCAPAA